MNNADMPVMPQTEEGYNGAGEYILETKGGLTKREYFASLAMQGYASAVSMGIPSAGEIARLAVVTADALLAELDKEAT